MRKVLIAVLAIVMVLAFAGCTNTRNASKVSPSPTITVSPTNRIDDTMPSGNVGTSPDLDSGIPNANVTGTPAGNAETGAERIANGTRNAANNVAEGFENAVDDVNRSVR